MKNYALLLGNAFNNVVAGNSWKEIIKKIVVHCGLNDINDSNKPFPILYDEIFLSAVKKNSWHELDLKKYIAGLTAGIDENDIHRRIRALGVSHIMTTNYDYTIQGETPRKNEGLVAETLYSVYRKHQIGGTTFWHIHGECNYPASINLGYEHYCGQLQNMRNYTVSGTNYKSDKVVKKSLISRLKNHESINYDSWIDLFFVKDIYILGLNFDFVESDLWWLLTYRARNKFYKNKVAINNKIVYYIPKEFEEKSTPKLEVMRANGVEVRVIDLPHNPFFYNKVLDELDTL